MGSILYYIGFILFTVICFVPMALLFLLTVLFDKERVALHWASRFWAEGIYRICPLWKLKVTGKERIDRKKNYVIITNHQSMLDIPLMYTLPLTFKWVSKREVLKWPVFGLVLWMHGDILVKRGSSRSTRDMMRQAKEILGRGKTSVIMFPEGTRSKTGRLGHFREGAFAIAKYAGVGILPVVHEGNASLNRGWRLRMPHTFQVRVLDPISPEEVAASTDRELAACLHDTMLAEHKTMRPDLYENK